MVKIPAENGVDKLDCLAVVRDCHVDKNRTHVLSHELRGVETITLVRLNNDHKVNIFAKNG